MGELRKEIKVREQRQVEYLLKADFFVLCEEGEFYIQPTQKSLFLLREDHDHLTAIEKLARRMFGKNAVKQGPFESLQSAREACFFLNTAATLKSIR